jgi:hypothetical protein
VLELEDRVLRPNLKLQRLALRFDAEEPRDELREVRRGGDEQFRLGLRASKVLAARLRVPGERGVERRVGRAQVFVEPPGQGAQALRAVEVSVSKALDAEGEI